MSSHTRSSEYRFGLLFLVLQLACGGRSGSVKEPPAPPGRAGAAGRSVWMSSLPRAAPTPEHIAPPPRIRVGLTTQAEAAHLTSSLPFWIRAGNQWLSGHDVLIDKEVGGTAEGWLYAVQLRSFLTHSDAAEFLRSFEEETGLNGRIRREAVTGRFAVRVGDWSSPDGAEASAGGLTRMGYEGSRVVAEPVTRRRPTHLVLRRMGAESVETPELSLQILPASPGGWIEVDGAPYRGYVEVMVNASNRLTIVNVVSLEDYVKGVVPAELSPALYPELEAIKAQAVAARTYAVRHRSEYGPEGFDICATPACQVYRGVAAEHAMGNRAVTVTSSEILTFSGEPIDALYTSTCGGRTEDVGNVFDSDQPYLVSRPCFAERAPSRIVSSVSRGLSWEAAGAVVLGIATDEELLRAPLGDALTALDLSAWSERTLHRLGQTSCPCLATDVAPVSVAAFATFMTEALCWEGRLPFLIFDGEVDRLVPEEVAPGLAVSERRALAYWIREQWIRPRPEGLNPHRPLSRLEALESLYRLAAGHGEPPLREASVIGVDGERLVLKSEDMAEACDLSTERYLFHRVEHSVYFTPALSLMPGDRILFHKEEDGLDFLILLSHSTSFDRSSRFFRWTVRKNQEELTRTVNTRERLGRVLELRPKRYGRSGRVAELEIVGTERTVIVRGLAIRRWLGLRESLFYADRQVGSDGSVVAWLFTGGGWGHGVGLCQVGAYGMATAGYDYRQILEHYYPGTEIRNVEGWR